MGVEFCQKLFCIYWDDHMVFIFQFVDTVHHIDWFAYTEESLHPWDISHLILGYDPFKLKKKNPYAWVKQTKFIILGGAKVVLWFFSRKNFWKDQLHDYYKFSLWWNNELINSLK